MPSVPSVQELAQIANEREALMVNQAKWLVYQEGGDDGWSGRTEGWLAVMDPRTNQPTIPCGLDITKPTEVMDIGGEMGRLQPVYFIKVPVRISAALRDRFQVDDGHTYEVVTLFDAPTFNTVNQYGCRRVT